MGWCFVLCLSVQWYKKPLNTTILLTLCLTSIPYSWLVCFANWYCKCPITTLPTFLSQSPNQCPWTKWAVGVGEEKATPSEILKVHRENINSAAFAWRIMHLSEVQNKPTVMLPCIGNFPSCSQKFDFNHWHFLILAKWQVNWVCHLHKKWCLE